MSHKQLRIYATNDDQCGNGMHALLNWYQGNGLYLVVVSQMCGWIPRPTLEQPKTICPDALSLDPKALRLELDT